jgi:UrcA family protein
MTSLTARIAGLATLALAVLPVAALSTAAHAQTAVRYGDLDLASPSGKAAFSQRADRAVRAYCLAERSFSQRNACEAGVKAELKEKLAIAQIRQMQLAQRN